MKIQLENTMYSKVSSSVTKQWMSVCYSSLQTISSHFIALTYLKYLNTNTESALLVKTAKLSRELNVASSWTFG